MGRLTGTGKLKWSVIAAYFLIYVVWGSTYFFIGVALRGMPPFLLGALRFTAAGLLLLAVCCFRGEPVFGKALIKRSAVSGIVLLFIDMAVVMLAQRWLSSSLVAIIAASTAIWIMALDAPMWKKNFRNPATVAGIVLGFLGVMMLYIEQLGGDEGTAGTEYGVMLMILGCISWALGTLYTKYRTDRAEHIYEFAGSAWQMLFAGAAFWVCAIAAGNTDTDLSHIPASSWWALGYLVVFGSILAYTAYVWLLKVRPATEVATHAYVNPLIAVFLGVVFGHEEVTFIQIAGLIVILLSVLLVNEKRQRIFRRRKR